MTEKIKTTAPVLSVGADREQPNTKNHKEIIANETAQINLQAAQNPEKSRSGGLQIVSMTELYDTVYPPRTPVVKCPVCGGRMEMNLRCDNYFVEDEAWHEAADRYADFLKQNRNKKVVLLELGVGFNTPIIIRFPFEKMVRENSSYSLIRLNMDEAVVPESFGKRAIGIEGDMERAITDIRGQVL